MPRRSLPAAALAAAVAALGLYGLSFQGGLGARLPTDLDWRAAASVLARDARTGDAVALSPWWAERARLLLPPGLPVMALPRYQGEDLLGVRRVWVLSLPGAPGGRDELEADLAARAAGHEPPQRIGALALSRHDLAAPALARAFLPDLLPAARVTRDGRACDRTPDGRIRCGGEPGPARQVRAVDGLPRPCIAVPTSAAPLSIAFAGLPRGTRLRGHAGLVGRAPGAGPRAPVRVALRAGGLESAVDLGGPGWQGLDLGAAGTEGTPPDVELVVFAAESGREVCVDAWVAE